MDVRVAWFIERNFQNTRNFNEGFVLITHNGQDYSIIYKELYLIVKDEVYLFASTDVEETLSALRKIVDGQDIQPDTFTTIIANLAGKK